MSQIGKVFEVFMGYIFIKTKTFSTIIRRLLGHIALKQRLIDFQVMAKFQMFSK